MAQETSTARLGWVVGLTAAVSLGVGQLSSPVETSAWIRALGALHPVVLHLPIGVLLAVLALEAYVWRQGAKGFDAARSLLLALGASTAGAAAVAGTLLAWDGSYDADTLAWHKWSGLVVVVLAAAAAELDRLRRLTRDPAHARAYRGVLGACAVALVIGGHQGGSLTHGATFLTRNLPWFQGSVATPGGAAVDNDLFAREVAPILEEHCVECHGNEKQEGALRLTDRANALAGGESGLAALTPGDAMGSRLVRVVTLPDEHEQRMPPDGKPRLAPAEVLTLIDWIDRGARWHDPLALLAQEVPVLPPSALDALADDGLLVMPLSDGSPLLRVDVSGAVDSVEPGQTISRLATLAPQVVWLDASGVTLASDDLAMFEQFVNVIRLDLSRTNLTDDGLAGLVGAQRLERLNLYGTAVTDEGLTHLGNLTSLRHLYVWQTAVTPAGAERLKHSLPELTIDLGVESE